MCRDLRALFGLLVVSFLSTQPLAARSASDAVIERRIDHIQNGLLPAVLVKGESVPLARLPDRMYALHIPAVSIAVIHGGKLEWARGFGHVRIGGAPVTAETLFQAASISKIVTTLAVLKLVQAHSADLDTDVNQYLKTWKVPANEFTEQATVTLRGLLTHSAGVTVHGFAGYERGAPLPSLVQVLNGEAPANNAPIRVDQLPGKGWRYSGGGYVIVQQVLTDLTGVPFPQLMQERVLGPLGMTHSTFEQPLPQTLLAHTATPYQGDGSPVPGGPRVYPELAAAGLWTTPSDLARYAMAVQQAASGRSKRVLSLTTTHVMLTAEYNEQALGVVVGGVTAHRYFTHGGVNAGYQSLLVAYANGNGAVIMTNSDHGFELTPQILAAIAHEYQWPDYAPPVRTLAAGDATSFDRYTGAYRFESGDIVTFWRDGTRIHSRVWSQPIVELFPSSEEDYFAKAVDARWTFSTGARGPDTTTATLYQNGKEQQASRLDSVEERAALELSRETERRFKDQAAAPGSEAALTHLIAGLVHGQPNYVEMSSGLGQVTRQQLPSLQAALARMGSLQSLSFKRVAPAGFDVYDVKFEHRSLEFQILLDAHGRVSAAQFSP
jgi:CubicO group peptidase (beta-lactamase class C family)